MRGVFDIFRKRPGETDSRRETFEVDLRPGMTVLDVFHFIQEKIDPSLAYRYSCRGAICGSCAVRINGEAALACKTQAIPLAREGTVSVDPLENLPHVKDLVVDFGDFWSEFERVAPYLVRDAEQHDQTFTWSDKLAPAHLDQLGRSIDCIKCACCFSDCPKRAQDPGFMGPAALVQLYKVAFDPRDADRENRLVLAQSPGGALDCDSHANCLRVCPKDCRPLRAINLIKRDLKAGEKEEV